MSSQLSVLTMKDSRSNDVRSGRLNMASKMEVYAQQAPGLRLSFSKQWTLTRWDIDLPEAMDGSHFM